MPDRKHELVATRGRRAGKNGVGVHAREPFVNEVLVGLAAAERRWVVRPGVALARLHYDQIRNGNVQIYIRTAIEIAIKQRACPRISDGAERAELKIDGGRLIRWEDRSDRSVLFGPAVVVELNRHRTIKS